ncbi:tyrosine-type recombinase/integrase [Spongiibacter tropicus]|uniref:tyrosine-type recombinase/integrase n=1 Tax=Spongiibacter tropicus TaxID=454602 RepID=UPI0003B4FB90|nr:tyrosine-type recombinase/integrase [Spongiibacter tropicus]
MAKLTKSYIDRLPIPPRKADGKAAQVIYRDDSLLGFGLLVGSGGTKSFFVERRVNGRVKRMSIGRYGHLTPTQARIRAQEMLGTIAVGKDPMTEKRAAHAKSISFSDAFEDYLAVRKDLKPGTIGNYRKCVDGCFADWKPKRLIDISKDMVEKRHSEIGSRAPARANNAMRVLRAIFNHSMAKYEDEKGQPIISVNPVDRLSKSRAWYPSERRRTLLKPHELSAFFAATEALTYDVTRDYLRFLLFTGLRKTEAANLQWSHVCFDDRTFSIPDTKNGEPHTLPLPDYLLNMLKHRKRFNCGKWVFPSPLHDGPLKEPRNAVTQVSVSMGKPLRLHDLRRTFITIAESLDIPAYALKQMLNHRNANDVTAGYIVADTNRLRQPMEKVAEFILKNSKDTHRSEEEA